MCLYNWVRKHICIHVKRYILADTNTYIGIHLRDIHIIFVCVFKVSKWRKVLFTLNVVCVLIFFIFSTFSEDFNHAGNPRGYHMSILVQSSKSPF